MGEGDEGYMEKFKDRLENWSGKKAEDRRSKDK